MTFRPVLESIEVWGEKYIQYLHQQKSQESAESAYAAAKSESDILSEI
jgi:hypothetical protein